MTVGIANQLTLSRLLLSPVFVLVFVLGGAVGHVAALVIAILFEVTDLLDGYYARTRSDMTDFGKLFDPLADSVSRFSVFLCFLWGGYADLWVVALIFYRDSIVAYVRVAAAREGVVLAARLSGKLKAVAQGIVILAILLVITATPQGDSLAVDAAKTTAQYLMLIVGAVTAWSGVDYLWSVMPLLARMLRRRP
jgi:CDP-diacylglycerol--glycerol-3-phosphate 3-phosphatidyltransferase